MNRAATNPTRKDGRTTYRLATRRVVAVGRIHRGTMTMTTEDEAIALHEALHRLHAAAASAPVEDVAINDALEPYRGPVDLWEALDALCERALDGATVEAWGVAVSIWTERDDGPAKLAALGRFLSRCGLHTEANAEDGEAWLTVHAEAHGLTDTPQRVLDAIAALDPTTADWASALLEVDRG